MVREAITCITWREMKRGAFNDFAPINIFFRFKDEFARSVAAVETAGHNCGEKKVIVFASLMSKCDERQ